MDSNRLFCPFLDELLLAVPLYHAVHLDLPPLLRIHRRDRRRQPRGGAHYDDQAIISLGLALPGLTPVYPLRCMYLI